jgi:hypothetical protein
MDKLSAQLKISREDYEKLTQAGLRNGELIFVISLTDSWLASYPNDLFSDLHKAKGLILQRRPREAIQCLTNVLLRDPEFLEAYMLLSEIGGNVDEKAVKSFMFILGGTTLDISLIYPWAVTLRAIRMGIRKGELENTGKLLTGLLKSESNNPLVALAHSQYLIQTQEPLFSLPIVQQYHEKWPECLQFSLMTADLKMQNGEESEAINLLHQCVSKDPSGQVLRRMYGGNHEFGSLWDQNQRITLDMPIPSSVGVALEWNKLDAGNSYSDGLGREGPILQSNISDIAGQEKEISKKTRKISKSTMIPVYVILSTKSGLETKYGKKTAQIIIEEMSELSKAVGQKKNWDSLLFLPDDPGNLKSQEIQPVSTIDPWKIKLALNDLDKSLKKQSRMIGAVVIAGGHEIVPFHKLPNPTDDSDDGVLSDNPYSTSSGNYLLPEWPVGRLPDESGGDAGLLLEQIRMVTTFHQSALKNSNPLTRLVTTILDRTEIRRFVRDLISPPKNFGYSAAVWRRSSLSAFRPIGAGSSLRVTPPFLAENIDVDNLMKSKCAFFNLHGLSNTPEWYGQRDFSEDPQGPDFPIAITARDIKKFRNNVDLTFTEACYGGYIIGKKIDESIALKLISIGSQGLVASTCIAYGSVFPPLIGADLLAFIFWKFIKDGYSFGESLLQAKIGLVKVMSQRQGYLDGEDQKTLESFVLYGDPLGYLEENIYLEKQSPEELPSPDLSASYTDRNGTITNSPRISKQVITEINELVESYIPNLENAKIKIREHKIRLDKMYATTGPKIGYRDAEIQGKIGTRTQVTYSQKLKSARLVHEQFARVTLDETGKVIKLAVSR